MPNLIDYFSGRHIAGGPIFAGSDAVTNEHCASASGRFHSRNVTGTPSGSRSWNNRAPRTLRWSVAKRSSAVYGRLRCRQPLRPRGTGRPLGVTRGADAPGRYPVFPAEDRRQCRACCRGHCYGPTLQLSETAGLWRKPMTSSNRCFANRNITHATPSESACRPLVTPAHIGRTFTTINCRFRSHDSRS
jgi:hypothetical protein